MSDDAHRPVVRQDEGGLSLLFQDGTLQSRMVHVEPAQLVLEYTRLMMGFLLFQPAPRRIAMIGLGGGSIAKYCSLRLPDADFTAIEISPEVIALREQFGVPPDGFDFRVVCDDGAAFVRRDGEPLDVLLVDAFDAHGQPPELCSAAFYDYCLERLSAGGVLVVNMYSDDGACERRIEHIDAAFSGRLVVIKADESENTIVFAGPNSPFPPSFRDLVQRLRALAADHPVGLDATLRKIVACQQLSSAPARRGRRRDIVDVER